MRKTAGLTHVTVFTEPAPCGGECLYCPSTPGMPKSYLPHADIRRMGLDYSAAAQMRHWLKKTEEDGMPASKIEVIILGGSFLAHPPEYRRSFIKGIYESIDGASPELDAVETADRHARLTGRRIIGITVECRPDQIEAAAVRELFALGVTKIELGVQSLDDGVLARNRRGHDSGCTARAVEIIRSEGLKAGVHLLFGMPYATPDSDLASARRALQDPAFRPDHVKFYFCEMFTREFMAQELRDIFERGEWRPLAAAEREAMIEKVIPMVPSSTRISRIGRKCAPNEVEGAKLSLDRGVVERKFGCRCVRCREPKPEDPFEIESAELRTERWGEGEIHLEAGPSASDVCNGLLRMHVEQGSAIVRELHVYGMETPPGAAGIHQHRGVGKLLMRRAEELARGDGCEKIAVASGPGVREYYARLGYALAETKMMEKRL